MEGPFFFSRFREVMHGRFFALSDELACVLSNEPKMKTQTSFYWLWLTTFSFFIEKKFQIRPCKAANTRVFYWLINWDLLMAYPLKSFQYSPPHLLMLLFISFRQIFNNWYNDLRTSRYAAMTYFRYDWYLLTCLKSVKTSFMLLKDSN